MDSHLRELQDEITAATQGMSVEELTRHRVGKWNAAEVLEHLYLTYQGTVKGLERCLAEGKPLARRPAFMDRVRATVVTRFNYMPTGRKASERLMPRGMAADQVTREIEAQIIALDDAITRCEARFGRRTRLLDHPVLGPLTAHQWRKFHWVHGRHHVKQIRQLRHKE